MIIIYKEFERTRTGIEGALKSNTELKRKEVVKDGGIKRMSHLNQSRGHACFDHYALDELRLPAISSSPLQHGRIVPNVRLWFCRPNSQSTYGSNKLDQHTERRPLT